VQVLIDNFGAFAQGFWGTVTITTCAFVLAFALGTAVAACRVSPVGPLRAAGTVWIEGLRNTPLTVLLFIFYFGFPKIGIQTSEWRSGVLVCGFYTSAFVAETVRSGFNAVPVGQAEAARALGLTFPQTLRTVVVPQAMRTVVAPVGAVLVALTKNSALASTIGALELAHVMDDVGHRTVQWFAVFAGTAVAYLLLTLPTGAAFSALERRVAIRR
jgi:glutamate transport system permease protein